MPKLSPSPGPGRLISSYPPAASTGVSFHGAATFFSAGHRRRRGLLHVRRSRPAARAGPLQALPRPAAAQILQRSVPEGHGVQEVQLVPPGAGGRSPRPRGGCQDGGETEDGGIDGDVGLRGGGGGATMERGRDEVEEVGRRGRQAGQETEGRREASAATVTRLGGEGEQRWRQETDAGGEVGAAAVAGRGGEGEHRRQEVDTGEEVGAAW